MKLQFLYSKIKEKEKLLNIYKEYQWFIDNGFFGLNVINFRNGKKRNYRSKNLL